MERSRDDDAAGPHEEALQGAAASAVAAARTAGLEQLAATARATDEMHVRIAQSTVCRENVHRRQVWLGLAAHHARRSASMQRGEDAFAAPAAAVERLREDHAAQSPDDEATPPARPVGHFAWEARLGDFAALTSPDVLYPLIERHLAPVRSAGLRVTGMIDGADVRTRAATTDGMTVAARDAALALAFTVDDPRTGAVGATRRGVPLLDAATLDAQIGDALAEATRLCTTSAAPVRYEPRDTTVILGPVAVADLLEATLWYGLLDARKIAEGRTYLAGKVDALRFPRALRLAMPLALDLGGEPRRVLAQRPFNQRLVACDGLELIGDGQVRDLFYTPYWARRCGRPETFSVTQAPAVDLSWQHDADGSHATLDELIASTERGVYVANFWYLRMVAEMDGLLTGMTRDGLFAIENGKLGQPLVNMRWHDNPLRMLGAVTGATRQRTLIGRPRVTGDSRNALALLPALRVSGFHFSSVSES
jgi:predicted Zn-dependent protease